MDGDDAIFFPPKLQHFSWEMTEIEEIMEQALKQSVLFPCW